MTRIAAALKTAADLLDNETWTDADRAIELLRAQLPKADRLAFVEGVEALCEARQLCACEPAGPRYPRSTKLCRHGVAARLAGE